MKPGMCRIEAQLESTGKEIGDPCQQGFVLMIEGVFEFAVDIYLSEDVQSAPNEDYDFGARLDATSEIVIQLGDIADNLIGALCHRRAANAYANRYARMLGVLANVVVQDERVAFDQVYADPVVVLALLLEDVYCISKNFVERRRGISYLFNQVRDLIRGLHRLLDSNVGN